MPDTARTNSKIVAAYRDRTPGSARLYAEASEVFASGITHDSRYIEPYGLYIDHAAGPRKWDVDGNEYVDFFGGHGALLLGHNHPKVTAAIHAALDKGSHFGASHELELRWAQLVRKMVPSAEKVRFTSSGTEATHMAIRLARAFTGRSKIIRFRTHFHGWHDHMAFGQTTHFDGSATTGVLPEVAENVVLLDPGDLEGVARALEAGGVAAAILEPTGSSTGLVPVRESFLHGLRDLTKQHGALLIFDEVVTGFRVAPGGAQAHYNIMPDLTTLAKVLAGGLPGGAVTGRADVIELLDFAATKAKGVEKVQHQGTYNANPVSAAAGIATLTIIDETDACERASATAAAIRAGLNEVLEDEGVPWAAYGDFSTIHLFANPKGREIVPSRFDPFEVDFVELKGGNPAIAHKLRLAMMVNGVDVNGRLGGLVSATHGEEEVAIALRAYRESLRMLREDGDL